MLNETALTRPARPASPDRLNDREEDHQDQNHQLWWFLYQNKTDIEGLPPSFYEYLMENPTESRLSQLKILAGDSRFLEYLGQISVNAYESGYNSDCYDEETPPLLRVDPPLLRRWKTHLHKTLIERTVEVAYINGSLDV
jgi:hypothetical protein